jgi:hypothetical protein
VITPKNGQDLRWVPIRNDSGEEIPGFACLKVVDVLSDGSLAVEKPDTNDEAVWFSGPGPIPIEGYGHATRDWPAVALYDSADGTPANGDEWGASAGSWRLRAARAGYRVLGGSTPQTAGTGRVVVEPMPADGGGGGGGSECCGCLECTRFWPAELAIEVQLDEYESIDVPPSLSSYLSTYQSTATYQQPTTAGEAGNWTGTITQADLVGFSQISPQFSLNITASCMVDEDSVPYIATHITGTIQDENEPGGTIEVDCWQFNSCGPTATPPGSQPACGSLGGHVAPLPAQPEQYYTVLSIGVDFP